MNAWLTEAKELSDAGHPFVSVTLLAIRGEAPSVVGSKMLVDAHGLRWGTIGGGKVEAHAIKHAQHLIQSADPWVVSCETWNLQTDIGMTCGGEMAFLFEEFRISPWKIAVFGAGHVSQKLVRLLLTLNCQVEVIDSRAEWLDKFEPNPRLTLTLTERPKDRVSELSAGSFLVSMTQGHAFDVPVLAAAFLGGHQFPFVGVIGSAQKARRIKTELAALGVTPKALEQLHCPVGLPIGSSAPEEIAISVTAQLIQERDRVSKPNGKE